MSSRTGTNVPSAAIRTRVEEDIGWLVLDNPRRHNAMSLAMIQQIPRSLDELSRDEAVRVVVVSGVGNRAFCTGADISEFGQARTAAQRTDFDRANEDMVNSWINFEKPVIAMIRGHCIGGGILLSLYADFRIASDGSQFSIPAARFGLGYPFSAIEDLVQAVGRTWAAEILYSGRRLSAAEALTCGLVNRVVPDSEIESSVRTLAAMIAANAPLTVRACKAGIREAFKDPGERDLKHMAALTEQCFLSEDYDEGLRAFMQKRLPRFAGR